MIENIIKTSMIGCVLLSAFPAVSMQSEINAGGNNQYDIEKAILMKRIAIETGLPEDVVAEINTKGSRLDFVTFTCPSEKQLIEKKGRSYGLRENIHHMGVTFTLSNPKSQSYNWYDSPPIYLEKVIIEPTRTSFHYINYDYNGECSNIEIIYYIDKVCHYDSGGKELSIGHYEPNVTYNLNNPYDIKITCRLG